MNALFAIPGTIYSLRVGNFYVGDPHIPNSVSITLETVGGYTDGPGGPVVPTQQVYGFYLKASEARALASAILGAATEAKSA